jgi:hypothetical protein
MMKRCLKRQRTVHLQRRVENIHAVFERSFGIGETDENAGQVTDEGGVGIDKLDEQQLGPARVAGGHWQPAKKSLVFVREIVVAQHFQREQHA